jgi:hypothetical protein
VFRHSLSESSDEQAGDEADTVRNNPNIPTLAVRSGFLRLQAQEEVN